MTDYKTIEPGGRGETYVERSGFTVYLHGEYEESSVLAGRSRRCWLGHYETLEEAQAEHPDAELIGGSTHIPIDQIVSHLPDDTDY